MDEEPRAAGSPRSASLAAKMHSKAYRDAYVASHTRQFLARQIRVFRGGRSQMQFGEMIGKRQTVVSRLEDPNYGKWTLQTLLDVARKLDVAVVVRFVDFPTFVELTNDMSDNAARPRAYDQSQIEAVAHGEQRVIAETKMRDGAKGPKQRI